MRRKSFVTVLLLMCLIVWGANALSYAALETTEEEKEILQELFQIQQSIEVAYERIASLENNMEGAEKSIAQSEALLSTLQEQIDGDQASLAQLLASYQKRGVTSWLELFLTAESPRDLLARVNLFGEMLNRTKTTLDDLDTQKEEVTETRAKLMNQLEALEDARALRTVEIDRLEEKQTKLETRLQALREERAVYEERLSGLVKARSAALADFDRLALLFPSLLSSGTLPAESITQRLTLSGLQAGVTEEGFNVLLAERKDLPKTRVHFTEDRLIIRLPDHGLTLSGTLEITGPGEVRWSIVEGDLGGYPLYSETLSRENDRRHLMLDLQPLIAPHELKEIQTLEGELQLLLRLKLF